VLDGRYHIAIGHFPTRVGSLQYRHLLREEHRLYVGRDHPLFDAERDGGLARIRELEHVVRGYATTRPAPSEASVNATATANNMEAILVLILSGSFAGHLPMHFAEPWVKRRMLRPIASSQALFHTDFDVISRKDATPTLATRVFLEDIAAAFAAGAA
jgi:DNA-binding transcriptional LysR family regulator